MLADESNCSGFYSCCRDPQNAVMAVFACYNAIDAAASKISQDDIPGQCKSVSKCNYRQTTYVVQE